VSAPRKRKSRATITTAASSSGTPNRKVKNLLSLQVHVEHHHQVNFAATTRAGPDEHGWNAGT